ncbi:MAG: DUF2093 domain-containing protein [Pseudomonadota bacterium]
MAKAVIEYGTPEFRLLVPGAYVLCALTGQQIPLVDLRYWSVPLQEAYASAEIAGRRHEAVARQQGREQRLDERA